MSVMVFDGITMATDSQGNGAMVSFPFPKMRRAAHGAVIGAIGPLENVALLLDWGSAGLEPSCFPLQVVGSTAQLLVATKDKGLIRYNGSSTPLLHGHNKLAIGEGAPFAYGALYMGANAEQAVAAAIQYSPHCNGQPVTMEVQ